MLTQVINSSFEREEYKPVKNSLEAILDINSDEIIELEENDEIKEYSILNILDSPIVDVLEMYVSDILSYNFKARSIKKVWWRGNFSSVYTKFASAKTKVVKGGKNENSKKQLQEVSQNVSINTESNMSSNWFHKNALRRIKDTYTNKNSIWHIYRTVAHEMSYWYMTAKKISY